MAVSVIVDTGPDAGIYYCDFDLDEIRAYRENAIWGANVRRPAAYSDLLADSELPALELDKIIH